jgi:uncharacterized FAD-dependent dehydrogenase
VAGDLENVARVAVMALGAIAQVIDQYRGKKSEAEIALEGISGILDAVKPGDLESASPQAVQKALDDLLERLTSNDAAANAALDAKFGNNSGDEKPE